MVLGGMAIFSGEKQQGMTAAKRHAQIQGFFEKVTATKLSSR
jgi:hypothetical protein